jgi:multiple sugar transport system substrate-binding protein
MRQWKPWLLLMLAAILIVTACSNGGSDTGSGDGDNAGSGNANGNQAANAGDSGDGGKKTKVTFMTWEGQAMNDQIVEAMKGFEDQNPTIDVELIPSPLDDYGTKVSTMLLAGNAPDIFMVGNDMALSLGADGLLYDWSKQADANADFISQFFPGTVDAYEKDGKLFGLPGLLNTYGVFYNKQAFADAGLPEPKIGWTYEQMLDAAKQLTDKEAKQFGMFMDAYDPFVFSLYAVSAGGAPFADSINQVTKVKISPQFLEGVELFKQYIADGAITPPDYKLDNPMGIFKAGKLPMIRQGQWVADDLIRNPGDTVEWGYAPYPIVESETAILDAVGWSSPADIDNPEAVWKVLMYLDSEMYAKVLPETPVAPPAYQPAAAAYFEKLTSAGHQDLADGVESMLTTGKQPVRFLEAFSGKANPFIEATFKQVLKGEKDIAALNEMADSINEVIASSK